MIYLFSVKDSAAGVYNTPFCQRSIGEASRNFGDAVQDQSNTMSKHPHDFSLWVIGVFDEDKGRFTHDPSTGDELPRLVAWAVDYADQEALHAKAKAAAGK